MRNCLISLCQTTLETALKHELSPVPTLQEI